MTSKLALILGTHSFLLSGSKVGSQIIAEGLSQKGWKVDYVSIGSSPFDLITNDRRRRFTQVWSGSSDPNGVKVAQNLTEYAFRLPFPVHRLFVHWDWQLGWLRRYIPKVLRDRHYDVVIHEASPTVVWLESVRALRRVFRLSDYPYGFTKTLPDLVLSEFDQQMSQGYDEIWAVSQPLADWAASQSPPGANVVLLPNGVSVDSQACTEDSTAGPSNTCRAVYVGDLDAPWVDHDLLTEVADKLPMWRIDVFGPGRWRRRAKPSNLVLKGALDFEAVAKTLSHYDVGLIPYRDVDDRMRFVERPLKFYEYIGAGLGVASTNVGAMKAGMGDLACYGNDAQGFANAIVAAQEAAAQRPAGFSEQFLKAHSWASVVDQAARRLDALLAE